MKKNFYSSSSISMILLLWVFATPSFGDLLYDYNSEAHGVLPVGHVIQNGADGTGGSVAVDTNSLSSPALQLVSESDGTGGYKTLVNILNNNTENTAQRDTIKGILATNPDDWEISFDLQVDGGSVSSWMQYTVGINSSTNATPDYGYDTFQAYSGNPPGTNGIVDLGTITVSASDFTKNFNPDSTWFTITLIKNSVAGQNVVTWVDNITFTAIPEPTSLALMLTIGGLLLHRCRKRQ